jgi:hypothetical protein
MASPVDFEMADFGGEVASVVNARDNPLYKEMLLNWSAPILWVKGSRSPEKKIEEPCVYALVRHHGLMQGGPRIEYVGLTRQPKGRFANHQTGRKIVARNGEVHLTYAPVPIKGRNRIENQKRALEEIEHLLIWAVWEDWMWNERKLFTLPGMGTKRGNAWHITNEGFPYAGLMPSEIAYPWMITRP